MTSTTMRSPTITRASTITLVDGRSGAGKTVFAGRLAAERGARVVHMDDLYPGWHGLAHASASLVSSILEPLSRGEMARWQRWDWAQDAFGEWDAAAPGEQLVIEGCGALTPASRRLASEALWLEASDEVRHRRALARDGDDSWWELWREQEDEHIRLHDPRSLADRVVAT